MLLYQNVTVKNVTVKSVDCNIIEHCWHYTKYIYRKQSDLPTDSNSEEADDSIEPKIISVNEASKSLEIVHNFLQQQNDAEELFKHVKALDKYVNLRKTTAMK